MVSYFERTIQLDVELQDISLDSDDENEDEDDDEDSDNEDDEMMTPHLLSKNLQICALRAMMVMTTMQFLTFQK